MATLTMKTEAPLSQARVKAAEGWPSFYGTKLGFIGTSYSSGYGLTTPATERWTKKFADMVGATESNTAVASSGYVNEGAGGNSKFSTQATLLATDCTHVFVEGGINDAPLALTTGAVLTAVTSTITAIRARIPNVPITIISPFWMASAPSPELLTIEANIRAAVPADVNFVEGGPWMRLDRTEWQQGDGHPNALGAIAIASWLRDQLGGTLTGAEYAQYIMAGTSDVAVSTLSATSPLTYTICGGTILGAKSGWWELEGNADLYTAANGFVWVAENLRKIRMRSDVTSVPQIHRVITRFYHPGGDLPVKLGYDPSTGAAMIITSAMTKVTAKWIGKRP